MNGRETILARVREALRVPSDPLVRHGHGGDEVKSGEGEFSQWLPPVGETFEARRNLFAELSQKLSTTFVEVADEAAAHEWLCQMSETEGWNRVGSYESDLTHAACEAVGLPVVWCTSGYDREALESVDVGITSCEALIAQTGSVLVTAQCGGRTVSVLPPHHVVLARKDQMLPDLSAGYALLRDRYAPDWPSFISLITGPSRTGDIERILVLGAHGPKQLTVILINS
jgi:L-lactate dehydrogenase complex protein LldG